MSFSWLPKDGLEEFYWGTILGENLRAEITYLEHYHSSQYTLKPLSPKRYKSVRLGAAIASTMFLASVSG
jgi:hypothetical protein